MLLFFLVAADLLVARLLLDQVHVVAVPAPHLHGLVVVAFLLPLPALLAADALL